MPCMGGGNRTAPVHRGRAPTRAQTASVACAATFRHELAHPHRAHRRPVGGEAQRVRERRSSRAQKSAPLAPRQRRRPGNPDCAGIRNRRRTRAFAGTQEQYGTLGPSQRSAGKRQEQRIECGIGGAGRQSCVAWAWGSGHSTCVLAAPRLQPLPATSRGIPRSALQFAQGHRWRRIQHLARGEQTREQCRQHAQPTANDGQ